MATRKLDKTKKPKVGDVYYELSIETGELIRYTVVKGCRCIRLDGDDNFSSINVWPDSDLSELLANVEATPKQAKTNAVKRINKEIKRLQKLKSALIPNCRVEVRE